jgi:hypothetical protein
MRPPFGGSQAAPSRGRGRVERGAGPRVFGALPFAKGAHERAARYFERAVELARQTRDPFGVFAPTYHLAQAKQTLVDHSEAARLHADALELAEEIGNTTNMAHCLRRLAGCSGARARARRPPACTGRRPLPGRGRPALRHACYGPGFSRTTPVPSAPSCRIKRGRRRGPKAGRWASSRWWLTPSRERKLSRAESQGKEDARLTMRLNEPTHQNTRRRIQDEFPMNRERLIQGQPASAMKCALDKTGCSKSALAQCRCSGITPRFPCKSQ